MSYPHSNYNWSGDNEQSQQYMGDIYSGSNTSQWGTPSGYPPSANWDLTSAGPAQPQLPHYPASAGYPPTTYNQNIQTASHQGYPQYTDPSSTVLSPHSASASMPTGHGSRHGRSHSLTPVPGAQNPYGYYGNSSSQQPNYSPAPPRYPTTPAQIQLTEGPAEPPFGAAKACSHCGATTTPVWRRDPQTHAPLCNACGVYQSARHTPRPQALIDAERAEPDPPGMDGPECSHCGTRRASTWRRNKAGAQVCNACGVYERMNGKPRPLEFRSDKIRPREKHRAS